MYATFLSQLHRPDHFSEWSPREIQLLANDHGLLAVPEYDDSDGICRWMFLPIPTEYVALWDGPGGTPILVHSSDIADHRLPPRS